MTTPDLPRPEHRIEVQRIARWGPQTWRATVTETSVHTVPVGAPESLELIPATYDCAVHFGFTEQGVTRRARRTVARLRRTDQWRREAREVDG